MVALDKVIWKKLLIIGAAGAAAFFIFTVGYFFGNRSVVESLRALSSVEIIAVSPNATGDRINAWVKNVGVIPINSMDESEFFLIADGARLDTLKYSATGGDNTWVEDPVGSSWSPAETLHIIITLPSGSPLAAGNYMLRVSTPNGVTAEKTFGR